MTENDFLQAILDSPADEMPRLAFADWLLERGDPESTARGEFIQIQCQLGRLSDQQANLADWVNSAGFRDLTLRAQKLLAEYEEKWAKPVAKLVEAYQFRRGFIEQVTLSSTNFLRRAEELFSLAPVRHVRFSGGISKAVADSPWLDRVEVIDIQRVGVGDAGLRTLLASPHLRSVRGLDLSYNWLTDAGARALAESPVLAQLTHLNLAYNHLSLNGVRALYESPHWPRLRQLVLTGNSRIDSRALQFLGQALQGNAEPNLLRSLLQMSSTAEREYTNRHVRELAQEASSDPGKAAEVLAKGLGGSHRKIRSAAAQMVSQLGFQGARALPALVQRLYEQTPLVRDHVAPALARVLPSLAPELQTWLCLLANPLLPPNVNLRSAVLSSKLPEEVKRQLALVCARRVLWRQHVAGGKPGPAPGVDPEKVASDPESILKNAEEACKLAETQATKHMREGKERQVAGERARNKEAAWLSARLVELLQSTLPPAAPAAPSGRRGRKRG